MGTSLTNWLASDPQDVERRAFAELARRHLRVYIRQAWHVVEPANEYVHGWHIDAIAEHLEAVTRGDIRNLIINVPPRHAKSLITCVFWPTWVWATQPGKRFLTTSYAEALAIRDAVKSRRLIQSPWYQRRWGSAFALRGDQNEKRRYENDHAGHRIAVGVDGGALGEGGDILIADDPHNRKEAESDTVRQGVLEWWGETMSTRGNDPRSVAKVIIMQRLHEQDLTGDVLEKMRNGGEPYEHLCLPARYEPTLRVTGIGWADPRREENELLWPQRFGEPEVAALEASLGDAAPGQLQQRPGRKGGTVFHEAWWQGKNRYGAEESERHRNATQERYIFFDTAQKDNERNDYTAWVVLEMVPGYRFVLREAGHERVEFNGLLDKIREVAGRYRDGKLRGVVIEDKGSGTSALQTLRAGAEGWLANLLREYEPRGTKEYRAKKASQWCRFDCILFPSAEVCAPWQYDFEDRELFKFPRVAHDDQVDAFSMGIDYLVHFIAKGHLQRGGVLPSGYAEEERKAPA